MRSLVDRLTEQVGGAARRRAVLLLASVLALDSADKGAIGALAVELERSLHIGNARLGLLVTVSSLVGAVATVPVGVLTDRTRRTRLLTLSILAWSVAQAMSGLSVSFLMLLLTRLFLGAVTATAGPAVASLTGDLFPAGERGRMYGFILTGELLGAGFGVVVAGEVAGLLGWRAAFFVLALPSLALAWAIWRLLPEPARGGQSRLEQGATEIRSVEQVEAEPERFDPEVCEDEPDRDDAVVLAAVESAGYEASEELVLGRDAENMTIWEATRYVLKVRTNVVLIVSSSLGYFFFAGLQTFSIVYLRGRFGLSQSTATALLVLVGTGAIVGVLLSGRLADEMVRGGRIDARLLVGAVGYVAASVLFVPAILIGYVLLALPLFILAGAALAAPNPPLNAARLDVIPSRMWGRAEGIRTVLQTLLQAVAPLLFGLVSAFLGGGGPSLSTGVNGKSPAVSATEARGLEHTFLVMLVPLALSGIWLLRGRRHYPTDVASAGESDRRAASGSRAGGSDEGTRG